MQKLKLAPRIQLAVRQLARSAERRKEALLGAAVGALPERLHPNHITVFRLAAVCPSLAASLWLGWPTWATVAIAAAGFISDGLDGTMARIRRQQTPLGATLDAVADKLMVVPSLWILGFAAIEPMIFWLLVVRDLLIVGYTAMALFSHERLAVRSNRPGRWYMATVFLLLATLLLRLQPATNVAAGIAVIIGYISLPYYWRRDTAPRTNPPA